jgi:SAM-dependent methyltransferase
MTDGGLADPESFYDEYGEREWDRLDSTLPARLEFENTIAARESDRLENTIAALESNLPETGRVLDASGGAGRYAIWLATRGYDVALVDRSAGQLDGQGENRRQWARSIGDRPPWGRPDALPRGLPVRRGLLSGRSAVTRGGRRRSSPGDRGTRASGTGRGPCSSP